MKTYRYIPFFMALLMTSLVGCKKDFLNVVPKGQQVATTTSDYDLLMNSSSLYFSSFAGLWQAEALMGDDVAAEATLFNSASLPSQKSFRWEDDIYLPGDRTLVLRNLFPDLYTYDKVINEVMESKGGTEQQKKAILAEARASRAWAYFQLINIYGKPYVAATAATDLGFPIIKNADITQNDFERNTVQEVYDFIISDLTAAIPDLPVQSKFATRFSKPAGEGLLGKVYLFMGDKNLEALSQLNAAFTDIAAQSAPAKLYDYNVEFAPGGKFLPIINTGPSNSPGQNTNDFTESVLAKIFYNGPYTGNEFGTNFVVLSPSAQALFGPSDLRLNFYGAFFPYSTPNPSGRLSKYSSKYARYGLELPELYLLRAEVKARLNDLSGATKDVETLRKMRIPTKDALGNDIPDALVPPVIAADQTALIKFILDERVREFATQGYRWFDMRRLSVDPLFGNKSYTHILYNDATSNNTTTFTLRPERLTLRLPPFIMDANPQFQNNP